MKKISTKIAVQEVTNFLKKYKSKEFRRGQLKVDKIKEDYIDVIEAVEDGLLIFKENGKPVYKLRHPLGPPKGQEEGYTPNENSKLTIEFKDRVTPTEKAEMGDGLEIQTQLLKYSLRLIAFITKQPEPVIDRMHSDDYDTINQICSVF